MKIVLFLLFSFFFLSGFSFLLSSQYQSDFLSFCVLVNQLSLKFQITESNVPTLEMQGFVIQKKLCHILPLRLHLLIAGNFHIVSNLQRFLNSLLGLLVLYISALSKLGQLSKISMQPLKLSYFKSLSKGFVSHGVITASQIKIMSWLTVNITTVGIAELYVN